ncbi:TIM barrel protein [Prosthecobacter sp.]|uniref:TIM barrel protein n=1 Tax=Prosthecobacter sp. TaxID=1965333 RepID=UPI003783C98E
MTTVSTLPQVSLISSWFVPPWKQWPEDNDLPALKHALEQQILLHDLYFLHPADIAWYARVAGMPRLLRESPLEFAAELTRGQLDKIADALTQYLADGYKGRLIGPRPRFTALATYWPSITTPDAAPNGRDRRTRSIKAVRNSLYLAMKLGCHSVEIVGGTALPEPEESPQSPEAAIQSRRTTLVQSLVEVFAGNDATDLLGPLDQAQNRPKICMEIEPGLCFLLKDVKAFTELHAEITQQNKQVADQVFLNIDVAHMMLTEGDSRSSGADVQLALVQTQAVKDRIGHMHISDHTRSHASDLTPGTYHFYTDFAPWLKLAIELTQLRTEHRPQFSNVIAVEMEACADIHEAARAIGRLRRWIQHASMPDSASGAAPSPPSEPTPGPTQPSQQHEAQLSKGAIIVFDIANSTECLTSSHKELQKGAKRLERLVSKMCHVIHAGKGSAWSFTGDGLIAHFDIEHFLHDASATADSAFSTCQALTQAAKQFIQEENQGDLNLNALSMRVGMHWGEIFVPTGGPLRFEAFGRDVVVGCRTCDFVKNLEKAVPHAKRTGLSLGAMTQEFYEVLTPGTEGIDLYGPHPLKGVGTYTLHTRKF